MQIDVHSDVKHLKAKVFNYIEILMVILITVSPLFTDIVRGFLLGLGILVNLIEPLAK